MSPGPRFVPQTRLRRGGSRAWRCARRSPGRRLVPGGLLLFAYVMPVVAAALLWRTMLDPQYGIVNSWLEGQPLLMAVIAETQCHTP